MKNNQLSGTIPLTIGRLTKLESLSMSGNQLVGTIPSTIFNLSSLQLIYLYRNQLSGTLPPNMCHHLPNLKELRLSQNQLRGGIPIGLSACAELEWLSLYSNNFTGTIPVHIGNLSRLQVLYFHGNQLTGVIPTTISNMSSLEKLSIGSNRLQGNIPAEIGQLPNLNTLNLAENKLNGEVPSSIFNISKLQVLILTLNKLSGKLPPSIATGLPHLERFYVGGNQFSGIIPTSFTNLSKLTDLSLFNNSFSGHIPTSVGNFLQLRKLSLAQNLFTNNLSIPEQDFLSPLANCKHLEWLVIGRNPGITGRLPKSLGSVNLSTTLEQFRAVSCGINGPIPHEIGNLSSLIWLDIGSNKLVGGIPKSFGSTLTNLQRLELYGNMLQGSIPHSFSNMKSLYSMILWGNKLGGQLPLFFENLTLLEEIDLTDNAFNTYIPNALWFHGGIKALSFGQNFFEGSLSRDIGNLKSLVDLDISGNQLSGEIPDSIHQLQDLSLLLLSSNKLRGHIPESFSELKSLEYLDLSNNNIDGPIPKSLENLTYLEYFNVSFNELSGEIPNEGPFPTFPAEWFIGNKGLCGAARFNVVACKLIKPNSSSKSSLPRYIIPPVASVFVVVTILIIIIRYRCGTSPATPSQADFLSLDRISYYDILRATNNLDEQYLIGRGSTGSVYKGEFPEAMVAAVKVFDLDVQSALKSFDTECRIMRSIRHRNLVKVITSCSNLDFKALVMEYMSNGNLDKWLYSTECSLNVSQRLEIMIDVAAAIEYLHHGYSTPIIHCDLKPSNILLDNDMVAHVSDFGIAKLLTGEQVMPQTKTLGTIGYMAPEYGSEGLVSTMVDSYSYGILLMETFTRKKPTAEMFSEELTMKRWVSESFPNSLEQIVDDDLLNINESARAQHENCWISVIGLALECTAEVPEQRPSMKDVLVRIKKIKHNFRV